LPQMLSWVLYMIETNIRDATLLGILTGTGIGFSFNLYFRSMNYHAASLVVIVIVFTVFLIEYLSNYVRREIL
ncbi:MAG: phosphonate ABC transporter permease, partial [Bacillota bacterium]